ncbi:MAG: type II secretion system F family protein [Planctomycetota bacterium]
MAQISLSQMAKLFYRLANSYSAGIDLRSIFQREALVGGATYRRKLELIERGLSGGQSLADCLRATDGYFPGLAVSIVEAGERGGRLEQSFQRLAHHYEQLVQFRNRFLLSIAWPMFELAGAIVIIGLLILLLGWIMDINNMEPFHWFGVKSWRPWQDFLMYVTLVLTFFGGLTVLVLGTLRGWFGNLPMDLALRLPLIGKTIESLALSRFAWTLSVAENAGMSATDSLQLAFEATQNHYYERFRENCVAGVARGEQFFPVLNATGAFPPDFLLYISNGEVAGQLAETMDRAARELRERAENNLKLISVIGFMLSLLLVATLIGFTVITLYQKLYIDRLKEFSNF